MIILHKLYVNPHLGIPTAAIGFAKISTVIANTSRGDEQAL